MTDSNESADQADDQMDPVQTETDSDTTDSATTDSSTTAAAPQGKKQRAAKAASESASDAAPAEDSAGGGTSSGSGKQVSFTVTRRGLTTALLSLVTVVAIVGCGVLGWLLYQDRERAQAFDDSKAASAEFVTKLVSTLSSGNAANYKDIIGPLSTGALRERLEQERSDTEQGVEDLKLEATAAIVSSAVDSYSTDSAKTVVIAQVTGRSSLAPNGTTNLMVFLVDLRKVDGAWLVSEFGGPPGTETSGILDGSQLSGETGATGGTSTPAQTPAPTQTPAPAPGG